MATAYEEKKRGNEYGMFMFLAYNSGIKDLLRYICIVDDLGWVLNFWGKIIINL